jgi:Cu+-exporting ATPase
VSLAVAQVSTEDVELADWVEIPGSGVTATAREAGGSSGSPVRLGSLQWLSSLGVGLLPGNAFQAEWSKQGATVVGLAAGVSLIGLFAVRDTLKPGAEKVVSQLQNQGLKTYLVTGDNSLTAAAIARQVGIPQEHVFSEVRPQQKADFIKSLQKQGDRIGFIGDGINDAPALEQADLGIAVSRASDIAREAADIILLKSEIQAVPESLGLARATLRTIKQNLFWAFFYNVVLIPAAAFGYLVPMLAALAMAFSSVFVVTNSLRLRKVKI